MSQWTHVSGCIRIDGMPQLMSSIAPAMNIERFLGTPGTNYGLWNQRTSMKEPKDIPTGSEGSLQYTVSDAGTGLVWKTVAVWGDLRDFGSEDTPEIDAWFARIVASPLMLRAAHLLVEVEYGERYLLVADTEAHAVHRVDLPAKVAS